MDQKGGRYHWVINMGRAKSAVVYCVLMLVCFNLIFLIPWISRFPITVLLGLGTLPLAIGACRVVSKYHSEIDRLIPSMGLNVMVVLLTNVLLGVGLLIA